MYIRHVFIQLLIIFLANFLFTCKSAFAYEIEIPPYYGIETKFIGNLSESYNSNISFASDQEDRIDDFVTRVSGGLNIKFDGRKRRMEFDGRMNRQYRAENFDSINPSEDLNITYKEELSLYDNISLKNALYHTYVPESIEDFSLSAECEQLLKEIGIEATRRDPECSRSIQEFGRFEGSYESYKNNFNANYQRYIHKYLTGNIGYGNRLDWSSREDLNDSVSHSMNLNIAYAYDPATSFNVSYNYAIRDFENSGDVSSHSPRIGIKKHLTQRLLFYGSAGIVFSTLSDEKTSSGRSLNASLTHEISEKINASIRIKKENCQYIVVGYEVPKVLFSCQNHNIHFIKIY